MCDCRLFVWLSIGRSCQYIPATCWGGGRGEGRRLGWVGDIFAWGWGGGMFSMWWWSRTEGGYVLVSKPKNLFRSLSSWTRSLTQTRRWSRVGIQQWEEPGWANVWRGCSDSVSLEIVEFLNKTKMWETFCFFLTNGMELKWLFRLSVYLNVQFWTSHFGPDLWNSTMGGS